VADSGERDRPVRIANCSGFFGDRRSAAREMVSGGPIDVLTGDWLAELTMLILARQRARRADAGYARSFVDEMREVLADCAERGIRVVSNAGGVNPIGCADAVRRIADDLGLDLRVAAVVGDDLMDRFDELAAAGEELAHLDSGTPWRELGVDPVSANAYLGGWGIATALGAGADVVVTGRVTDAALVIGPAAWWHGWARDDWDALAGALVAGHVVECGAQATGGNYAFFEEVPGLEHTGFPIAEVAADGSSVITKHPGTGGRVSVGSVTAQLLYEIGGPRYANPDVVARFDTVTLSDDGPDRVRIGPVRGEPAPPTTKVCINYLGGFKNTVTLALTGLDVRAKGELAARTLWSQMPGGREAFEDAAAEIVGGEGFGLLHVTVVDRDEAKVGRAFSNVGTEIALASYPGFFTLAPPGDAREFGVYWPALVASELLHQEVLLDGDVLPVDGPPLGRISALPEPTPAPATTDLDAGPRRRVPIGLVMGARSGDKGGDANVGVWVRSDAAFGWLAGLLTPEVVRTLLPETGDLPIERHDFPNLRALNFVVKGLLGRGVAASTRFDTQAKSLGERLRVAEVEVPEALLAERG
jgi:hypothetical protein